MEYRQFPDALLHVGTPGPLSDYPSPPRSISVTVPGSPILAFMVISLLHSKKKKKCCFIRRRKGLTGSEQKLIFSMMVGGKLDEESE